MRDLGAEPTQSSAAIQAEAESSSGTSYSAFSQIGYYLLPERMLSIGLFMLIALLALWLIGGQIVDPKKADPISGSPDCRTAIRILVGDRFQRTTDLAAHDPWRTVNVTHRVIRGSVRSRNRHIAGFFGWLHARSCRCSHPHHFGRLHHHSKFGGASSRRIDDQRVSRLIRQHDVGLIVRVAVLDVGPHALYEHKS